MKDEEDRLRFYRRFVYEMGCLRGGKKERQNDFELSAVDRFRYRTRYFTDSGIIGTKAFVERIYQGDFKHHFTSKHEKCPKGIKGLRGVYSLKRLPENI